jgi:hypothetical protein
MMRNVDRLLGLWKHVQLLHDVPAAASSLASAPSGVDMLDCKLNADENRRMEIGQNIPKKTYYSFSFITFLYYHISTISEGMNIHNTLTASWWSWCSRV